MSRSRNYQRSRRCCEWCASGAKQREAERKGRKHGALSVWRVRISSFDSGCCDVPELVETEESAETWEVFEGMPVALSEVADFRPFLNPYQVNPHYSLSAGSGFYFP